MTGNHLYRRIASDLSGMIASGALKPGDQVPSVPALRGQYGVSHITVLHAFKKLASCGQISKERGRGYFVTSPAAALPDTIGCLMRGISALKHDHYYNEIMHGIQKESAAHGYDLLFSRMPQDIVSGSQTALDTVLRVATSMNDRCKGLLLDERINDEQVEQIMKVFKRPVVIVDRQTRLPINAVTSDFQRGFDQIFATLLRMGYDRLVFCDSGTASYMNAQRKECFMNLVGRHRLSDAQYGIIPKYSVDPWEATSARLEQQLERSRPGRAAILACTDNEARGLCDYLLSHGYKLSVEVAVIGVMGNGFVDNAKPELSTLKLDSVGIGEQAAKVLMAELNNEAGHSPQNHLLPANFVFGETI